MCLRLLSSLSLLVTSALVAGCGPGPEGACVAQLEGRTQTWKLDPALTRYSIGYTPRYQTKRRLLSIAYEIADEQGTGAYFDLHPNRVVTPDEPFTLSAPVDDAGHVDLSAAEDDTVRTWQAEYEEPLSSGTGWHPSHGQAEAGTLRLERLDDDAVAGSYTWTFPGDEELHCTFDVPVD